jgi:hypothetical protein
MRTIAEQTVLIRTQAELPAGFKVATDPFRESWNLMRLGNSQRLEKKIRVRRWNCIKIAEGTLRSGVGKTEQESVYSAVSQALRQMNEHFNAAEVDRIEVSRYPWFFVARVRVYPYRIQPGAELVMPGETKAAATRPARRRPSRDAAGQFQFGSAMPLLKELLMSPRRSQPAA